MDDDLLVIHLTNISNVMDGLGPPPGFKLPNEQRHFLLVLSTALVSRFPCVHEAGTKVVVDCCSSCIVTSCYGLMQSDQVGGSPTRQLNITMRQDVYSVRPVEPDAFQGFADGKLFCCSEVALLVL
jgi:hypothetical protein